MITTPCNFFPLRSFMTRALIRQTRWVTRPLGHLLAQYPPSSFLPCVAIILAPGTVENAEWWTWKHRTWWWMHIKSQVLQLSRASPYQARSQGMVALPLSLSSAHRGFPQNPSALSGLILCTTIMGQQFGFFSASWIALDECRCYECDEIDDIKVYGWIWK